VFERKTSSSRNKKSPAPPAIPVPGAGWRAGRMVGGGRAVQPSAHVEGRAEIHRRVITPQGRHGGHRRPRARTLPATGGSPSALNWVSTYATSGTGPKSRAHLLPAENHRRLLERPGPCRPSERGLSAGHRGAEAPKGIFPEGLLVAKRRGHDGGGRGADARPTCTPENLGAGKGSTRRPAPASRRVAKAPGAGHAPYADQ